MLTRYGVILIKKKKPRRGFFFFWRRHPESDRGIADLQSAALPLGYGAVVVAPFVLSRPPSGRTLYALGRSSSQNRTRFAGLRFCMKGRFSNRGPHCEPLMNSGAAYEARTRYLHLGKVALYQMS